MYRFFKDLFNMYQCTSQTKHVPSLVMAANDEEKRAYLKGYHLSDGSTEFCIKYATTSPILADQVRFLNWQLGLPASLSKYNRLDKRTGYKSVEFSVKTPKTYGIGVTEDHKNVNTRQIAGGILQRIRKIEPTWSKEVYDLQVRGNHNYLTTSFLGHNSAAGSLICYCLGITDVDPIQHDLLFSRFLSEARGGRSMKLRFDIDPIQAND